MKYIKLFEESNITTLVSDGNLLQVDDIIYHPSYGKGKILNMRPDKVIATILFPDYFNSIKDIRIDVARMQIDKDLYEVRANANKYNL